MASMTLMVESSPGNDVLSSYNASLVGDNRRGHCGCGEDRGTNPKSHETEGPVLRAEKSRGLRPIGVEAKGVEGATVVLVMPRGDEASRTMFVAAPSLALAMTGELLGAEDRLAPPPEPPRVVMRTCSGVMACRASSLSIDEAVARLAWLSPSVSVSESETRLAELALSSET